MKAPRLLTCCLAAAALGLSSCSSEEPNNSSPSFTTEKSSTSSSATAVEKSTTSHPSTSVPSPVRPNPAPPIAPNNASPEQSTSMFVPPSQGYQCPGTDAYVRNPSDCTSANLGGEKSYDSTYPGGMNPQKDPSQIPFANGGTCPAYKCGYGTDANGNPNPSSGELQTLDGCNAGYITDQSLCNAVRNKANQYGW